MANRINWQDLRSFDGDQRHAFEELCCQLAAHESMPAGLRPIRKGSPDAGVECFWILPNGDEHAWQAKFFQGSPDDGQWGQLDKSVKDALEKHPQLVAYTICLPSDRADPRIKNEEWFLDKWNQHVAKWEAWARELGRAVEFLYWGEHEIFDRLSREEHRGRYFFWFQRELFSDQWFRVRLAEAVANAGERYTPELNVELPIAALFDALGRTESFFDRLRQLHGDLNKTYSHVFSRESSEEAATESQALRQSVEDLVGALAEIYPKKVEPIDWAGLERRAVKVRQLAGAYEERLQQVAKQEREAASSTDLTEQQKREASRRFDYEQRQARELASRLYRLERFALDNDAKLANGTPLVLLGDAGTGKTHLFCDVAEHRLASGLPTILLLGEQFGDGEPWSQMAHQLGLSCTREELLGALEAAAEKRGAKALILIDALNEGEGRNIWRKHLSGMLTLLARYPWVSLAVSVRTTYVDLVLPDLSEERLVRSTHQGFAGHEQEAMRRFFSAFGITRPSVPLMSPEFQNPLFLKLFCRGLKNRGLTRIPQGFYGITAMFDLLVDSVNDKLAKTLDFDSKAQPVQKGLGALAHRISELPRRWLSRREAQRIIDSFLPREGYQNTLFRHLLSEGLLSEDRFYEDGGHWTEGIRFSYERFGDHLIVRRLMQEHVDPADPAAAFHPGTPLGSLLADKMSCCMNRGLIEALTVQIPEFTGRELAEVAPHIADFHPVRMGFVVGLIWRVPGSITPKTREYINGHVVKYPESFDALLDTLLTLAPIPEHPYNADFLHRRLVREEMAERDAWWSIYLHEQYGAGGAVDRLVEWAWSEEDKSHVEEESIRLCATALSWFLTTSNRFLRDRATKALVALLTPRMTVIREILVKFAGVDDLYVLERLFAVAYGCALRSTDREAIEELAKEVYRLVFKDGRPVPHILLRDYARGVIEVALHRGAKLRIPRRKIRPPYGSEWPSEIPSEEGLKVYREWQEGMPDVEWTRVVLYESIMGFGDFARYIIGTNSHSFNWSACPLSEPPGPSPEEVYHQFVQGLTARQRRLWGEFVQSRRSKFVFQVLDRDDGFSIALVPSEAGLQAERRAQTKFERGLGKKKKEQFRQHVLPFLEDSPSQQQADEKKFDLSLIQRWILKRVLDLGWTVERFGRFDLRINWRAYDRTAHKSERIGKKYQWLAWHEILARVADNFEYDGDRWSSDSREKRYDGPWQISARDIDPSCLLKGQERNDEGKNRSQSWWTSTRHEGWHSSEGELAWLQNGGDLPRVEPLIEVTDPDHSQWLMLQSYPSWEQPVPLEEDPEKLPRRQIWYQIRSYIARKTDIEALFEWAKEQSFMGRWMPESSESHGVFLGEFFWSPAFRYHDRPYYHREGWTQGDDKLPKPVLVTTDGYMQEGGGYDGSLNESISVVLPAKWLAEKAGLSWNGVDGAFYDPADVLTVIDPSVEGRGQSALLVRRESLLSTLARNDCDIFWTVLGEKQSLVRGFGHSMNAWLEINGVYRLKDGKLDGALRSTFKGPEAS